MRYLIPKPVHGAQTMARKVLGKPPFPLHVLDTDEPVSLESLIREMGKRNRMTLCIRSARGHERRGGFFFHLRRDANGFDFLDFQGAPILSLPGELAVKLVNHVTGLTFDQDCLLLCQRVINLRHD